MTGHSRKSLENNSAERNGADGKPAQEVSEGNSIRNWAKDASGVGMPGMLKF